MFIYFISFVLHFVSVNACGFKSFFKSKSLFHPVNPSFGLTKDNDLFFETILSGKLLQKISKLRVLVIVRTENINVLFDVLVNGKPAIIDHAGGTNLDLDRVLRAE